VVGSLVVPLRRFSLRRLALSALSGTLLLAGCGGGSSHSNASGASASPSASASASASPCPSTQTASAPLPRAAVSGVAASGSYGDKPTLTFSGQPDQGHLGVTVLSQGKGPVVRSGDLLEADYLGQVWSGTVFDNSYDRKQSASFPIGVKQVIPGWDQGLVGQHVGSRVLLALPPSEGYGCQGQSTAHIKGTDTIVFVVDIVAALGKTSAGQKNATPQKVPAGLPKVTGALGSPASISLPKGYRPPTKARVTLVARGTGPKVTDGVFFNFADVETSGKKLSSWTASGATVQSLSTANAQAGPFAKLKGMPVGSRVIVELPANAKTKTAATAVVLDLVGVPETAKQAASS